MYLRIASSPDLVDYLYHVLLDEAEVVHPLWPIRIVQARGRFFFVSDEPVGFGGPFSTIAELIRSEGQREKLDAGVDPRPPAARVGRWTCFERQWSLNGDQAELEQLEVG